MALVLKDRVKESTTTTGTGTLTLLGASTGYQSFTAIGDGNTCYYAIATTGSAQWEVGIGTYTASGTTLSRDTILDSSTGGGAIDLAAGTKDVFVTYPSEKAVFEDASGDVVQNQFTSMNVTGTATINVGTFTTITGAGSGITTINASNISSGTLANDRTTAASANGASTIVARDASGNFSANVITANGSALTALNATSVSSGTLNNARTTAASANGASTIVARDASGNFVANVITANGSALTALNATAITTGTLSNDRTTAASANGASTIVARDASGNFVANVITHGAGSNTAPSITTAGDTNTGIFFPAADTIAFTEGGTEAMRIDSSGNVGIGTSSPTNKLSVVGGNGVSLARVAGASYGVTFNSDAGVGFRIEAADPSGTVSYEPLITNGSIQILRTGNAERMRIDSSGNLLVGTTTTLGRLTVTDAGSGTVSVMQSGTTAAVTQIAFANPNGFVGSITTSGSSTAYNTSSDYRLKENIAPMTGALATVQALKPVTYKWKIDGSNGQGFIAHELQEVVPDCVTGEKDGEQMQGVDYGKITPLLTAALQEALAKIESLEARLAVLESK
jgi:hypothetical protein